LFIQSPFSAQGILPHSDAHTIGEGLLSISSFLDSKGFSTKVFCADELYLDLGQVAFGRGKHEISLAKLREVIKRASPRIVGVSALTPQYSFALEVLKICKEIDPSTVTVIGGPHVTFVNEKVFSDSDHVDIVVRGEGEWTMAEIAGNVLDDKPLDNILGISFRKGGRVITNPPRPLQDISTLPAVDYSKIDPAYLEKCSFTLTFTRGCPFNCSYCVEGKFWGDKVRTRNLNAVMEELAYITENHASNGILFLGSVFNFPESFFKELCARLKELKLSGRDISVLVGAAYLPEEHVRLMKESGIRRLLIAVESASPEILKRMKKNITFDLVVEKCRLIRKYGLEIGTFWIFGHPGETESTAARSLDAMVYMWEEGLNDRQEVAVFTPYPGIPILEECEEGEMRIVDPNVSQHSRFDRPVVELSSIPYQRLCDIYREAREIAQYWSSFNREIFSGSVSGTIDNIFNAHKK